MIVLKGTQPSREMDAKSRGAPPPTLVAEQLYLSALRVSIELPELFQIIWVFGSSCLSISAILPGSCSILAIFI